MRRPLVIVAAALTLVSAGLLAALVPAGAAQSPPTQPTATDVQPAPAPGARVIAGGVTIAGIQVGGLSAPAALGVVQAAFGSPLVLTVGGHTVSVSPTKLAVAYAKSAVARARSAKPGTAVALNVRVRGPAVRSLVAALARQYALAPVDSTLSLRDLKPFVSKGQPGKTLDRRGAFLAILEALRENRRTGVSLPYDDVPQTVSRANFGPVIVIHRGSNRLYLYHGMKPWRTFTVATGQAVYPTPLGRFQIVVKWKDPWWYPPNSPGTKGEKPIPPGPGNPLGTRWMGLSSPGVGIHGTPDSASLGYSVSHGCIRMDIPYAEWLFDRVNVGTPVYIVPA